jgi:transcription initiation factor TFIID subunit 9B
MVKANGKASSHVSQVEGDPGAGMYPEAMPRDANIISLILKHMDVYEYDTRVIPQLLEFSYRYIQEVLQDAQVYAEHAGRTELLVEDIKLAIQAKINMSFTAPPSREVRHRNIT